MFIEAFIVGVGMGLGVAVAVVPAYMGILYWEAESARRKALWGRLRR